MAFRALPRLKELVSFVKINIVSFNLKNFVKVNRVLFKAFWVFAKVNRVRFSLQGNKFGSGDGYGNVGLWQAANATLPFFVSTILNIQG